MIESIVIKNFQAHESFKLSLSRHVTTLTGASDVGKSAIIRAFTWLALNKPRGEAFLRHGADTCSVQAGVDGRKVGRRRGKAGNEYRLDGDTFKAFGSDVPEAIGNTLGLDALNFQSQHDPPFWVGLPSPEVARQLNAIVDLGVVDDVAKELASRLRRAGTKEELLLDQIAASEEKLEELKPVEELNNLLTLHEDASQEAAEALSSHAALEGAVDTVKAKSAEVRLLTPVLEASSVVTDKQLRLVSAETRMDLLTAHLDKLRKADLSSKITPPDTTSTDNKVEEAEAATKTYEEYASLLSVINDTLQDIKRHEEQLDDAQKRLADTREVCKTCGRPL